jgi:hypothetical protein
LKKLGGGVCETPLTQKIEDPTTVLLNLTTLDPFQQAFAAVPHVTKQTTCPADKIELVCAVVEPDASFVVIADATGARRFIDLQHVDALDFFAFKRAVADQHGWRIDHQSQDSNLSTPQRKLLWESEVLGLLRPSSQVAAGGR